MIVACLIDYGFEHWVDHVRYCCNSPTYETNDGDYVKCNQVKIPDFGDGKVAYYVVDAKSYHVHDYNGIYSVKHLECGLLSWSKILCLMLC